MYRINDKVNIYHTRKYGPVNKFGYIDLIHQFKAPKFDADKWAQLYFDAGAKFAGPVAMHHDGLAMWDSDFHPFCATKMGPKRDIVGELTEAIRKKGMKVIASLHHTRWVNGEHYYQKGKEKRNVILDSDLSNPEYYKLYGNFSTKEQEQDYWLRLSNELVSKYKPDQLWFDSRMQSNIGEETVYKMAKFYYENCPEGIISHKHSYEVPDLPYGVGMIDIERGKMEGPQERTWQN